MMECHEIIKSLRTDHEPPISQTQLGKILHMTQMKVSRLETGYAEPNLSDIHAYCKYFRVSSDYLLGLTDDPKGSWLK